MTNLIKMEDFLSIGKLSQSSGIGVHTLRVWEKRYGVPLSQRLPSGHRRYSKDEVPRLRAIAEALESGYRASKVVTGTLEELQGLLGAKPFFGTNTKNQNVDSIEVSRKLVIEQWIEAIHQYDDDQLSHSLNDVWNKEGPMSFVLNYSVPFVERIGKGWVNGELTVAKEHFVTEILRNFISSKWRQFNIRVDAPTAVLATLPQETHSLGLLMCTVITCLADFKVVYLGAESPVKEITKTLEETRAQLLCLSISNCVDSKKVKGQLKLIKKSLNKSTNMIIGGQGAIDAASGIIRLNNFNDYFDWIRKLNN